MNKKFALIGAAGFVAPRHLKAIIDTGNTLVAAMDPNDSVGVMDSYFPSAAFFTEFERFDRHLEKLKRSGNKVDYVVVCSPNYLHDAHIRFGLRYGADVICEKPLVLNPWNIDPLQEMENETGQKIYNILQLRLHHSIIALKEKIDNAPEQQKFDIDLTYITSRGLWYYASWKGNPEKSGGIATNIGIHFFDMLIWIFGGVEENTVHVHTHDRAGGILRLHKANIRWFMSINPDMLPEEVRNAGGRTYRSIRLQGEEIDFSEGFTALHSDSYTHILMGKGFTLEDVRPSIELAYNVRTSPVIETKQGAHPFCEKPQGKHPFH
ncbi:MAG: Gfo/Idh/MocA family oxidoreductase [Saprospiraceae bacterium]|nr:Gfo/Idh/MocA family oxidoreductase [Saprospiraceae bacterium]